RMRHMYLAPFMLDELLLLYLDSSIELEDNNDIRSLTVTRQNPQISILLSKKPHGGYRLSLSEPVALLRGSKRIYLALGDTLFACDEEFSAATGEFFYSLARAKRQQMTIAEADMPALATTLLAELAPYLPLSSQEDLTVFQSPPLRSKVYLDIAAPQNVTARLEHWYGDKSHPGFTDKSLSTALDLRGEVQLETLLSSYFPLPHQYGTVCLEDDEDALFRLVDSGVAEISQLAEVFASDAFRALRIKPPAAVSVGVRMESDLLRLSFDLQGIELSELSEVLASYRKAKKYHRLRDGSFLSLTDSALTEFSELADSLDLTAKELATGELSLSKYRTLYLDNLLTSSARIRYDRATVGCALWLGMALAAFLQMTWG
ncbi:MAG: SNF2 helicase associated domain-containing protein, partial [Angelakisella sp.]